MSSQSPVKIAPSIVSAPIVFNDASLIAGFRPEDLKIDYVPVTVFSKQPRYAGRELLKPDIDLSDYRFEAVIDWIQFSFRLPRDDGEQQATNIQPELEKRLGEMGSKSRVYVSGPDTERPRYQGKTFVCTVHDPKSDELRELLRFVEETYRPSWFDGSSVRIVGIEIAFDAYVKDRDQIGDVLAEIRRWQMTNLLRRHVQLVGAYLDDKNDMARCVFDREESGVRQTKFILRGSWWRDLNRRDLTKFMQDQRNYLAIPTDATFYMGAENCRTMFRSMDKITDRRDRKNGPRVILAPHERRARLEVRNMITPEEIALGYGLHFMDMVTPDELFRFRFQDWNQTFFKFWLPTLPSDNGVLDPCEKAVFERCGIAGLEHFQGARLDEMYLSMVADDNRAGERKGTMLRYTDLNQKARRAMRTLSERWQR